ncbi:hypothetical protein GCM10007049_36430 [Echinicola pacifica]|uniref:DUF3298 domain-containing protein n=1 Tax=Echinicola pacifica TaxID=346377 RepID=A0A918QCJ2_9BACT|nr:DUF3298 and DUF4163 domain-containing protein [Echinicola pacifica]GGZ39768.1 hypothetical protein GCM10007049_36430 [Echinicola pacifica]
MKITFLLAVLIGLGSCGGENESNSNSNSENNEQELLGYEEQVLRDSSCLSNTELCAEVSLHYPVFQGAEQAKVDWLNGHVEQQLLMYFDPQQSAPQDSSLKGAVARFLDEATKYNQDSEFQSAWMHQTNAKVSTKTPKGISLMVENSSYTGGAHPISTVMFLNFDLEQQRLLKAKEVVLKQAELQERVLKLFKEKYEVPAAGNLAGDGRFFLDNGEFFLPSAMGYEGEDLVLIYNPYEIAPYSFGLTEIRIPLDSLAGIVWMP